MPSSPETPAETPSAGRPLAPQIVRSSTRLLVVEDNDAVGQFSTELLHDLGFKTTWVSSAHEALSLIAANPSAFDLVLSDVVMPGMGGLELAQALKRDHPRVAVILASGYTGITAAEESRGVDLLAKPYSLADLSAAIERALHAPRSHLIGSAMIRPQVVRCKRRTRSVPVLAGDNILAKLEV